MSIANKPHWKFPESVLIEVKINGAFVALNQTGSWADDDGVHCVVPEQGAATLDAWLAGGDCCEFMVNGRAPIKRRAMLVRKSAVQGGLTDYVIRFF